jgi:hypothetical protein
VCGPIHRPPLRGFRRIRLRSASKELRATLVLPVKIIEPFEARIPLYKSEGLLLNAVGIC